MPLSDKDAVALESSYEATGIIILIGPRRKAHYSAMATRRGE